MRYRCNTVCCSTEESAESWPTKRLTRLPRSRTQATARASDENCSRNATVYAAPHLLLRWAPQHCTLEVASRYACPEDVLLAVFPPDVPVDFFRVVALDSRRAQAQGRLGNHALPDDVSAFSAYAAVCRQIYAPSNAPGGQSEKWRRLGPAPDHPRPPPPCPTPRHHASPVPRRAGSCCGRRGCARCRRA